MVEAAGCDSICFNLPINQQADYLLVISAIVGAIVGGFISFLVTLYFTLRQDYRDHYAKAVIIVATMKKAFDQSLSLHSSILEQIPEGTEPSNYWAKVIELVGLPPPIKELSANELEVLSRGGGENLMFELDRYVAGNNAAVESLEIYVARRAKLVESLEPFIVRLADGTVSYQVDWNQNVALRMSRNDTNGYLLSSLEYLDELENDSEKLRVELNKCLYGSFPWYRPIVGKKFLFYLG
ncbi:MAG: hypothetical protein MRY72_09800 [Aquisalinus sp.]|nr:hypothetical protein [Aquisalinus sp.]